MRPYKKYFKGRVLNAGSGTERNISMLVKGKLYNQDIYEAKGIDIVSPLDKIPVKNNFFDCVICNAVLEHVENPIEIMREIYRVTKKGGYLYLCVPFMQPEHLCPTDFQRYTKDGLKKLTTDTGFKIKVCKGINNVYQTVGWVATDWLLSKNTLTYRILRRILFPILRYKCMHSDTYVESLATGYRIIAIK